jgi:hypothetical protein
MMAATRNAHIWLLRDLAAEKILKDKSVRTREGPDSAGDHTSIEDRPAKPRDQKGNNLRVQN